jgi:uncharacterized membrane protein YbhN (UPF0104 family)
VEAAANVRLPPRLTRTLGALALAVSLVFVARAVEPADLAETWRAAAGAPLALAGAVGLYALAFVLRAATWSRVLPALSFAHALAAIHVSLAGNHVLPFRLGEALRVTSAVRRGHVPVGAATASTVFLRSADVLAVVGIVAVTGPHVARGLLGGLAWALLAAAGALWLGGLVWLRRIAARGVAEVHLRPLLVAVTATLAWLLESAVLWQSAAWAGIDLSYTGAAFVTAATIAAQVVAIAPGGFGTYEAAATAGLVALGAEPGPALAAALTAHAIKTAYALGAGTVALVHPQPGLLGRLRLPKVEPRPPSLPGDGDVVLFLPARDEEARVGAVVTRVPDVVLGRRVRCVVVDDGSSDRTAAEAETAGAVVVRLGRHRGLGAAVRAGLAEAVDRDAAAVAFCDADGEYAPEELERLVAPILRGEADYVVGSRFAGGPRRMRPHRRAGNVVLTWLLRVVARRRITDGQSGYRALSPRAAAAAELVHDFNYAQVLTLDLLGKGYRYAEVPITYRFRTSGRSFVRVGGYLRRVLPAMHRELNAG